MTLSKVVRVAHAVLILFQVINCIHSLGSLVSIKMKYENY